MLIEYRDLTGKKAFLNTAHVMWIRAGIPKTDPKNSVVVKVDSGLLRAAPPLEVLVSRLQEYLSLAAFSSPLGRALWTNAQRVTHVREPGPGDRVPDGTRAILHLWTQGGLGRLQYVAETPRAVRDRLDALG